MFYEDTVAAIATSSKDGSISVIRVSGKDAIRQVSQIFYQVKGEKWNQIALEVKESHTIQYGFICDKEKHEIIDEVLVLLMRAPKSYTAEDVVEIQCHGGYLICQMILELLVRNGVRIAEPGEFTKRAFLNGRLDLSQAESVMDIIQADSKLALGNSLSQLRGNVRSKIAEIREVLLENIAFLEAALDDPEHISLDNFSETLSEHVDQIEKQLAHLIENSENGRIIKEGVHTVIVGKPNVGKSSFMNRILKEDRAIVTDIPGTTRDTLEEELRIGSTLLTLIDTAGIHETEDVVESIGITKAKQSMEKADLVLCVLDSSEHLSDEDMQILRDCQDKKGIILLNKSDLEQKLSIAEIEKITDKPVLNFSASTGDGLEELEHRIHQMLLTEEIDYNKEIYITNLRQKQALLDAAESIRRLRESIDAQMPEDLYSIDMTDAYESLGKIIGETIEDDIVDKIFKDFCMGK